MLYFGRAVFPHLPFFINLNKPHNKAICDTLATAGISRLKPYNPVPAVFLLTFSECHKPHNKAVYGTLATARKPRSQPYIPVPAVFLLTFSDCHKPHNKAIYGTSATARKLRPKPYIPVPAVYLRTFSDCHKPHNKAKCNKFPLQTQNGRHDFSCLPSYFYQYHAVKPHCKAK